MTQLADQTARDRIQTELDTNFIVEAAAGTGKTTQLVGRVLGVIASGRAELKQIVAVTFTEKAAGEMKLRLRSEIERARHDPNTTDVERDRLVAALGQLEETRIGTIHSLCSDLLHERPVEAEIDPLFSVMAQEEAERLFDEAFDAWFQQVVVDPPEGVRRILRRRRRSSASAGPADVLRSAGWRLAEQRDFDGPWETDPDFDRNTQIDELLAELGTIAEYANAARKSSDKLLQNLHDIRKVVEEIARKEAVQGVRDYDGVEADLRQLASAWSWKRRGYGKMFGDGLARADVLAARDAAKVRLDGFIDQTDADVAARLHGELRTLLEFYEQLKERVGKLDFLDLLLRTRDLIRDREDVRRDFQERFTHVFIDEFQDTDPLQAEILILLSADDPTTSDWREVTPKPGKLFIVGDPKQSIYRFRRADVALYESIKERLTGRGVERLDLTTSFRAVPNIQRVVNVSFEPCMQAQRTGNVATQPGYVALDSFRPPIDDQPSVVALPVPRPYDDWGKVRNYKMDDSLPDAVAAFVHWLLTDSGWKVTEREDPTRPVPIAARHVCLLFRRFKSFRTDVTRGYRRALEARRIPHVLVGGRSFHEREEILAIRNALAAIEWPDDEFSVFATLRGPFFALQDDVLLAYRTAFGRLHPLRRPDDAEIAKVPEADQVVDALAVLRDLYRQRNRAPVADTISRLLEATRAHASLAIWPSGEQALANALRLIDVARRFEAAGATSFRSFVERVTSDADRGQASEAPVIEEGTDGVRVMTVHQAKGLEFPVVILCDPNATKVRRNPSRYVDTERRIWAEPLAGAPGPPILLANREAALIADEHEAERLTYVAATRARDVLVVPTVGDEECSGWLDVLNRAVYPAGGLWRESTPAPGCPDMGEDSVLTRPLRAERSPADSVRPGLHRSEGEVEVVWWDPTCLDLDVLLDGGLRQDKLLQADTDETVARAGLEAHGQWQASRDEALRRGGQPTRAARPVTAVAEAAVEAGHEPPEVPLEHTNAVREGRPHGKRFGTLVHAVLSLVPLEAGRVAIEALARTQGRLIGAPGAEIEAAVSAVEAALAHPLIERARQADALRRETPIVMAGQSDEAPLTEGIVDLAFLEGDTWTVVDFKTDADPAEREPTYRIQVQLYADAIARATGQKAVPSLLWV